jgi:hypothetical protein
MSSQGWQEVTRSAWVLSVAQAQLLGLVCEHTDREQAA